MDAHEGEVTVDLDVVGDGPFAIGDMLEVRVTVPHLDDKVTGGVVKLTKIAAEHYTSSEYTGDVVWDTLVPTETTSATATDHRYGWEKVPLWPDGAPRAGTTTVRLPIPVTAEPTVDGAVRWVVEAQVDRRLGVDPVAERPVVLVAPRLASAPAGERATLPPAVDLEFEWELDVERLDRTVRPGATLTGLVAITPKVERRKRARVRVALVEQVIRRGEEDPETTEVAVQTVADDVELPKDRTARFPFSLTLPADARAVYATEDEALHWLVQVTVDRKSWWRTEWTGSVELDVR